MYNADLDPNSFLMMLLGTCGQYNGREELLARLKAMNIDTRRICDPVLEEGTEWDDIFQTREDAIKEVVPSKVIMIANPENDPALEKLPISLYSIVQMVTSAFQVGGFTRVLVDRKFLARYSKAGFKAYDKTVKDLEKIHPGITCASWDAFVGAIAELWNIYRTAFQAFLAGTCGNNPWRELLFEALAARGVPVPNNFIDPRVKPGEWSKGVQFMEDQIFRDSKFRFFNITDPMEERDETGQWSSYSIVEAVIALFQNPTSCCVAFDERGISGHSLIALQKTRADLKARFPRAVILDDMDELASWAAKQLSSS